MSWEGQNSSLDPVVPSVVVLDSHLVALKGSGVFLMFCMSDMMNTGAKFIRPLKIESSILSVLL